MIQFASEETIERTTAEVWAYAADIARHPEWMGVTGARVVHGSGTEIGAPAVERMPPGSRIGVTRDIARPAQPSCRG